jgi:hypothetical protein
MLDQGRNHVVQDSRGFQDTQGRCDRAKREPYGKRLVRIGMVAYECVRLSSSRARGVRPTDVKYHS